MVYSSVKEVDANTDGENNFMRIPVKHRDREQNTVVVTVKIWIFEGMHSKSK